jgi:uncharacterized membrane protein YeaQ/YmgE (transglycosylase-associated protein family)
MSFLVWIVFGLIAGLIATMIMPARTNWVIDIIIGIVGAAIGGTLFNAFGATGVTGFNLYSIMVAIVGAVVLLAVVRAVQGKRVV